MPYRTSDDRIDGVVLTFVDVTQRKLAEAQIAQSERRFRAIVSQSTAGIAYVDRSGALLFANDRLLHLSGWTSGDLAAKTIHMLTVEEEGADTDPRFQQLLTSGVPFDMEKLLTRGDAPPVWVNVSVSPIRDANGTIESAVAVALDLTERRRAQADQRHSEAHLRSVLESMTDHAIVTVDENAIIRAWNVGAERMFGYSADEAIGQSAGIVCTPEDRAKGAHLEEVLTAQRQGRALDERWHVHKDGSRLFVSGVLSPIGPLPASSFVKVARDLTDRKQTEEALKRAHDGSKAPWQRAPLNFAIYSIA